MLNLKLQCMTHIAHCIFRTVPKSSTKVTFLAYSNKFKKNSNFKGLNHKIMVSSEFIGNYRRE